MALFLFSSMIRIGLAADGDFTQAPLSIVTASGKIHPFTVELALDADQRALGLMNRREMTQDRGMLFDFAQTRRVMMWMKDTYLPLDMLFAQSDGIITSIHENAEPLSQSIIDSGGPIAFVLEVSAGTVKRLKIALGDRLESARIQDAKP